MADIPAGVIEVTRNSDGTCVLKIYTGSNIGPTQMLNDVIKLTTAQCTIIATRLAQGAIGGAGSAGTDTILTAATTADAQGTNQTFNAQ